MLKKNKAFFIVLIVYVFCIFFSLLYSKFLIDYVYIPECPIYKFLGLFCPCCGSTRAMVSLANLDILQSIKSNPIILYVFSISSLYLIIEFVAIIMNKKNTGENSCFNKSPAIKTDAGLLFV